MPGAEMLTDLGAASWPSGAHLTCKKKGIRKIDLTHSCSYLVSVTWHQNGTMPSRNSCVISFKP